MPQDTETTIPVLIHVNPDDWREFKRLAGKRRASLKVRLMIRNEIAKIRRTV